MSTIEKVHALRRAIKTLAISAKELMSESVEGDIGEVRANTMLTYRHLEDAGMRLGKVIQAM